MSMGDVLGAPITAVPGEGEIHAGAEHIRVETRAWPRVVLRWPRGVRSDTEVAAALRKLARAARRARPYVLLVDARDARVPSPAQLGMLLELARRVGPHARCVAQAVVTRSPAVRALIDSLRWMHLTPARWGHFEMLEPAIAWLEGELEKSTGAVRQDADSSPLDALAARPTKGLLQP